MDFATGDLTRRKTLMATMRTQMFLGVKVGSTGLPDTLMWKFVM